MRTKIYVSELFRTIQGEGILIGKPTVFVRTGGCDYHCSWCDSLYAVLSEFRKDWILLEPDEIFSKVRSLSSNPILITLSGGNPAMEPLEPLIDLGHSSGYTFALETQGSISQPWFSKLDYLTLSPKGPSSGMKQNWQRFEKCLEMVSFSRHCTVVLKIVVFNDYDYAFARDVSRKYPSFPLYLQTGNSHIGKDFSLDHVLEQTRWLIEKVKDDHWNEVTILPQFHTLLWGNKRGV